MTQAAPDAGPVRVSRHPALYCTPHMKISGVLAVSPLLVVFDPDPRHPHVREFGVSQYEVRLEVSDIFDCGAIAMPVEEIGVEPGEIAYYLQLHVRTLDGRCFCAKDLESGWCIVFRMQQREELYEAARVLLDSVDRARAEEKPAQGFRSRTSIPFACLDCMTALEATSGAWHQPQPQEDTGTLPTVPLRSCQTVQVRLRHGDLSKTLLTPALADRLLDFLPIGLRLPGAVEWVLRYTPKAHGVSLATLFRNVADDENTILMIEDAEAHVFGGFAPEPWEPCHGRFYGSGEAFVFSFGRVEDSPEVQVYPWTNKNSCLMYADNDLLAMGGGDGRHAFVVRSDLLHGCSSPTATFGNPLLAASEEFVVRDLEVWAFEEIS
uniref:Oxidation resistance protein 1 n=2 Tax=Alexandrium monilatum TaxID=311494 RepID=A0A7S4Q2Z4_9DINO|mmetsp:Transcript_78189/g.247066  ORF Transcript_78189/g.247066 Transcript_78189/m.247066 type:complete len:379 (-) Transcript_78189:122-1258(-)